MTVTSSTSSPIPAATVILVREAPALEVFLLRRHRASSFMSNAYVFPGGKVDPADGGPELAAVRELYEEAGVLLCEPPLEAARQAAARARLNAGEESFTNILAGAGLAPALSRLHWWSRWVTPSAEPKRFDAIFFVAELPPAQTPSFDNKETVDELWIAPAAALARQAEGTLRLPPPQLRTMHELVAAADLRGVIAASKRRHTRPDPICPRISTDDGIKILLPWDPEYATTPGEGRPIGVDHVYATPPSRFIWSGETWREM